MRRYGKGMGPVLRTVREIGLALITAGVIILLFAAYQLFGTSLTEEHHQASLKKAFAQAVANHGDDPTVGGSGATQAVDPAGTFPGGVLDRMVIPRISLSKYVVQGVAENDLMEGPGHYPQTVLPGEQGNSAIAGHRTTYGAPFFRLNELHVGDRILITNLAGRQFVYKVSRPPFVVSPSDVAVLDPTATAQLTLTTCNPRFSATSRLIVVAKLVGTALPVAHPAELAAAPPADNSLGSGNNNAWPVTIGFGALVLVAWIATRLAINVTRRWWRLGAYVVGIGVCLIPLWFLFENVTRLLPQNI